MVLPGQLAMPFAPTAPPKPPTRAQVQRHHLERVAGRIADDVLQFCREQRGRAFHLSELTAYVTTRRGGSTSSPDRILRELRRDGAISYVVDRAASLYVVEVRS